MKTSSRFLGALLAPLAASLVQPVIPSVVKGISGRGVRRAGRGYTDIVSLYPLNNIEITNYFNYEPRPDGVFSRNILPRIRDRGYVTNLGDFHYFIVSLFEFHCLLIEIEMYILILLELNMLF